MDNKKYHVFWPTLYKLIRSFIAAVDEWSWWQLQQRQQSW